MLVVLREIGFQNDPSFFEKWLGPKAPEQEGLKELLKQAEKIAKPKALYLSLQPEARGDEFVIIRGEKFLSRVLAVNLSQSRFAFPFAATCGREIEEWAELFSGPEKPWAKTIMGLALGQAMKELDREIISRHGPGNLCMMNPGSLEDWPLSEQEHLFSLLGDTGKQIGLELKPDFFMKPEMSASGIKFYADFKYENCLLCDKDPCPGRRAPFQPETLKKYQ